MRLSAAVLCLLPLAEAFSTFAGSCKHAGVNHGLDKFAAQEGSGGHSLSLSRPGVNVPGATVTLTLSGARDYKGLLLLAEVNGVSTVAWGESLPEGIQKHPHCKQGLTHDTYHVGGKSRDDIPWVVPADLPDGAEVTFRATVVRDYSTWFAFERTFVVGSEDGAGGEAPTLVEEEPANEEPAQTEPANEDAGGEEAETRTAIEEEQAATPSLDMAAFRSRQRSLRLLHGFLMAAAWLVCAPAGALAARYFKSTGAFWFDAHRVLQGGAVAATLFGAAIALGILHPSLFTLGLHGKLGVCVVVMSCLQPLNAFSRPAKTAGKTRAAWKRLHSTVGWLTILGGAVNCLVGVNLMILLEGDAALPWYVSLALLASLPFLGAATVAKAKKGSGLGGLLTVRSAPHARSA